MKLKYKQMLLFITMCIMGIGMLTISFNGTSKEDSILANSDNVKIADNLTPTPIAKKPTVTSTTTPIPTPTVTPVPEDPTKLKLNTDEKLNNIINAYFKAKIELDEEALTAMVTDPEAVNIEILAKVQEYLEAYSNIVCYTKPGTNDGDLIVYATYDMKITTIDTYAPSIDYIYVTTSEDDYRIIYSTKDLTQDQIKLKEEYFSCEDVKTLVTQVDDNLKKAQENDSDLNDFINNLTNSIAKKDKATTETSADSKVSDESTNSDTSN